METRIFLYCLSYNFLVILYVGEGAGNGSDGIVDQSRLQTVLTIYYGNARPFLLAVLQLCGHNMIDLTDTFPLSPSPHCDRWHRSCYV
jgi:hypothetical protein